MASSGLPVRKAKLHPDPSRREALRVAIEGLRSRVPFDVVHRDVAAISQVVWEDQARTNFSAYAIIKLVSKQPKLPAKHEELIWRVICEDQSTVAGASRENVLGMLSRWEDTLGDSDFFCSDFSAIPNIFVWTLIRTSVASSLLDGNLHPRLSSFVSRYGVLPHVKAAVALFPTALRSPLPVPGKFYLTTAINYTNGPPHIGHAYEGITSDFISRYHRKYGREVFFLTGTDEHGQKIAATAEGVNMSPKELCDFHAMKFKELNEQLCVTQDRFIRTTDEDHLRCAQRLWKRVQDRGYIHLGTYVGWYNVREEKFVTEMDAQAAEYKDDATGKPLLRMEEPSYFFQMSKFQNRLLEHIKANPLFISPETRRNEILGRLQRDPLEDLSVSRTTFKWGVPVPDNPAHVMYVWFDALTNYLTGCQYPDGKLSRFWPADVHVIGKDISWFHCVIWPCMLMAAEVPLPKVVFAHGFVNSGDGKKMSKSFGNVIDPVKMVEEFGADTLRFFLIREARYGADLKFDRAALAAMHNADLADTLGNLLHRGTTLCSKFCDGVIPDVPLPDGTLPFDMHSLAADVERHMQAFELQETVERVLLACKDTNKYLTENAPWSVKDPRKKQQIARGVMEALYILAHFLEPVIPSAATRMYDKLGQAPRKISELSCWFENLKPGSKITVGEVLFQKIAKE